MGVDSLKQVILTGIMSKEVIVEEMRYFKRWQKCHPLHVFLFRAVIIVFLTIMLLTVQDNYWKYFIIHGFIITIGLFLIDFVISAFVSSKFLTKVELNDSSICIDYLDFNTPKTVVISLEDLTYGLYLKNRWIKFEKLMFFEKNKPIVSQYQYGGWTKSEMNNLIEKLKSLGVRRPFGENM